LDAKGILREIRRRSITLVPGKPVVSIFPGEWPSPFEGKGFEPLRFRDFELGDNPRHIHLPTSARRGADTVIERVALRDVKIMVVVDRSPSMSIREKLATQFAAAALLLYSAWQSETTFGLAVQYGGTLNSFGLGIGSRHFYHLYRQLSVLCSGDRDAGPRGAPVALSHALPPNAMLVYCSDFLQERGKLVNLAGLRKTVRRYDLIPVIIQDEIEYSFPTIARDSFVPFFNPETREQEEAWITKKVAEEIREIHQARFEELKASFGRWGIRCIHLDNFDVQEIREHIGRFFRQRRRR
jgi:uncharacterized protein (DUF58 family)